MRKTVDFSEVEIGVIESEGRVVGHRTFSSCLRYCLRGLFSGEKSEECIESKKTDESQSGDVISTPLEPSAKLGIPLGDAAPFSKKRQVKGFGK